MKALLYLIAVVGISSRLQAPYIVQGFEVKEVAVGSNVSFSFHRSSLNGSFAWLINETNYSITDLPDDYNVEIDDHFYILTINEAKLWMNNTEYSYYDIFQERFLKLGKLIVYFNFTGPSAITKVTIGSSTLISCYSPLITEHNIYVVWKLNGVVYNSFALPQSFCQGATGITVYNITESMDGTTLQCLLQSNLLYKEDFWRSTVSRLVVSKSHAGLQLQSTMSTCILSSPTFNFLYRNFDITANKSTISWSDVSYPEPVNYYLIGSKHGITVIDLNLHESMNYTLTDDLLKYDIYIEARNESNSTVSRSTEFIRINPGVITVSVYAPIGKNYCYNDVQSFYGVIWPYISREDECNCPSINIINDCSCVKSTGYSVSLTNNEAVCWNNLTRKMNNTKIIFYKGYTETINEIAYPGLIIYVSLVLITSVPPNAPTIYAVNDTLICIKDNFNGNSQISSYNINVTNVLNATYQYVHEKINKSTAVVCLKYLEDILTASCKPLYITVNSSNEAGVSDNSNLIKVYDESDSKPCDCVKETVNITAVPIESTRNSFKLNVSCTTVYNVSTNFKFIFKLINLENSKISYECSDLSTPLTFKNLKQFTSYDVAIQWNIENTLSNDNPCLYQNIGPYKAKLNIWIIVGLVIAELVVLAVIIVIGIFVCKYRQKCCCRKNPPESNTST